MSAQQPEALRLADVLETHYDIYVDPVEAASELRRLHVENEALKSELRMERAISFRRQMQEYAAQRDELLEALRMNAQSLAWLAHGKCRGFHTGLPTANESLDAARAAIAKAIV